MIKSNIHLPFYNITDRMTHANRFMEAGNFAKAAEATADALEIHLVKKDGAIPHRAWDLIREVQSRLMEFEMGCTTDEEELWDLIIAVGEMVSR